MNQTAPSQEVVPFAEIISALSYALDLTGGVPQGHSARACIFGMRVGRELGLGNDELSALYYALLLKDAGCSTNAARMAELFGGDDRALKHEHKLTDWTRLGPKIAYGLRNAAKNQSTLKRLGKIAVLAATSERLGREMIQTRCERGADIARLLGLPEATAEAIRNLDEHWDGSGFPLSARGEAIPILGRILCFAQCVEIFNYAHGSGAAMDMIRQRSGRWFDPHLVLIGLNLAKDQALWRDMNSPSPLQVVQSLEPAETAIAADEAALDRIAHAFAKVIDAKTPYTFAHSERVAALAVGIGQAMDLDARTLTELRRAALLHDIGKLGVSNRILDKSGPLTAEEWAEVKRHPQYTYEILIRVKRFRSLAVVASSHHERLDGKGYHRGLVAEQLSKPARALVVADMAEALSAERPYRKALPWQEVTGILQKDAGVAVCLDCFGGLGDFLAATREEPYQNLSRPR